MKTREQNTKRIRDACIAANGDIVQLGSRIEIIGRPIRLADVLYARHVMAKESMGSQFKSLGESIARHATIEAFLSGVLSHWNLLQDDLKEQSDETLEFLAGLLGKKY